MKKYLFLTMILLSSISYSYAQSFEITPQTVRSKSTISDQIILQSTNLPEIIGLRHNGTLAAPTATGSGSNLLRLLGRGHDGTGFTIEKAAISMIAANTWTPTSMGTYMQFNTTAIGTTSFTERMRIADNGFVGIGLTNPSQKLNIRDGNILLETSTVDKVYIQASGANSAGEITINASNGNQSIEIRGSDALNKAGEILMYDPTTNLRTLEIDGDWSNTGKSRIVVDELQITGGADFAEYFNMVGDIIPEVGTVLSVSSNGSANLEISNKPYDSNVVGVLSGANGINPGIMLKQKDSKITNGDYPVAISGRVYVKAEATKYEIKPGDLLTSSNKAGFAMKATNKKKYAGAIIGKALTGLNSEEGFVLVLLGVK